MTAVIHEGNGDQVPDIVVRSEARVMLFRPVSDKATRYFKKHAAEQTKWGEWYVYARTFGLSIVIALMEAGFKLVGD